MNSVPWLFVSAFICLVTFQFWSHNFGTIGVMAKKFKEDIRKKYPNCKISQVVFTLDHSGKEGEIIFYGYIIKKETQNKLHRVSLIDGVWFEDEDTTFPEFDSI